MTYFKDYDLPPALKASLARMNFMEPTPIQAQAIPLALAGRDVLGTAQTGTGKTAAFAIPMITRLLASPRGSAMVLLPTRELAVQVVTVVQQLLGPASPIKTALLIGGESMPKQLQQLKMRPRIFVGTPGRINDHLARGSLMLHDTNMLVLDETDRMLDMGFGIQIDKILKFIPKSRQTLMFSATLPPEIIKLSNNYLNNPERIAVGATNATATNISQEIVHTTSASKYADLLKELQKREGSIIVFVKTKYGAERLADKLSRAQFSADAIHGDLQQNKRDRVIAAFRDKRHRILVATDIAARGLDIPHIEHVINYDLPQCPEDYIHRIGRTARAGNDGSAISLIAPEDTLKWRAIDRLLNPDAAHNQRGERPAGSGKGKGKRNGKPRHFRNGGKHNSSGNSEGRSSEGRSFGGQRTHSDRPESRSSEGQRRHFGNSEGRPSEGRSFEGKRSHTGNSEARSSSGQRSNSGNSEGRSPEGQKSSKGKRPFRFKRKSNNRGDQPRQPVAM